VHSTHSRKIYVYYFIFAFSACVLIQIVMQSIRIFCPQSTLFWLFICSLCLYEWFLFVYNLNITNKNWLWFSYIFQLKINPKN
jgi:hypothetical protein